MMITYVSKNEIIKLSKKTFFKTLTKASYKLLKGHNWTLFSKVLLKWNLFLFPKFLIHYEIFLKIYGWGFIHMDLMGCAFKIFNVMHLNK